jgi:hypothetical protein
MLLRHHPSTCGWYPFGGNQREDLAFRLQMARRPAGRMRALYPEEASPSVVEQVLALLSA